jgi:hypothetical protein
MKVAFGIAFTFIHVIFLSAGASILADGILKWGSMGQLAAWVAGGAIAFVPWLRTLFLGMLLFLVMPWWQAALLTPPIAFVLLFLEKAGEGMLKPTPSLPTNPGNPVETLPNGDLQIIDRDGVVNTLPGTTISLGPASLAHALNPRKIDKK